MSESSALHADDVVPGKSALQVITPARRRFRLDLHEVWLHRELLYFLTWRDIKVRYKQTVLGAAWAILQPFVAMVVFSVFFGRFVGLEDETHGVPYPVYVYAGLLPWTLFANSVVASGTSMISSANLVTKVYFPRIAIPLAVLGVALVDLVLSGIVLGAMMAYYEVAVSWSIALVPLFVCGAVLAAVGVGTLLSALSVSYRDFRYVVPFVVQLWIFVTPVIYPLSVVDGAWRSVVALNPMAGPVEGFRAAVLAQPVPWPTVGISLALAATVACFGIAYFRSVEQKFADVI